MTIASKSTRFFLLLGAVSIGATGYKYILGSRPVLNGVASERSATAAAALARARSRLETQQSGSPLGRGGWNTAR